MRQYTLGLAWFTAMLVIVGCATFETTAYRTIGTITVTTEGARKGWVDYVTQQRVMLAKRPAEAAELERQVAVVGDAYASYQSAMRTAKAAVITYKQAPADQSGVEKALNAVSAASSDFIALIQRFRQ